MSLKYGFLSLLALCVCIFVFYKNYEVWTQPLEQVPEKRTEKKSEEKPKTPLTIQAQKDPNSIRSYVFIAEKNIFSPERKDYPILTVEKSNPATRPQVILYGVTIAGDFQAASLANPGRPLRKGERETMTVKIGEKIGEYKLAKIQPDRITMESNGDSFEVLLYDARNPKKRIEAKTEVKPSTVTSTQPPPAPPQAEAPQAIPSQQTVEKPKEQAQQPVLRASPAPVPARPYYPSISSRRGRATSYPPRTAPTTGAPAADPAIPAPPQGPTGN
jgi:type II secretory pathway component PulC